MNDAPDPATRPGEGSTLPDRPELLDAAWLTGVLREHGHDVRVAGLDRSPVGTGQMGVSVRLRVELDGDPAAVASLPDSFVVKLPGADEARRSMVAGIHRTEVGFYRELAPTLAVRTPAVHHAAISGDATTFLLLLEDLAPRVQGDQIRGCSVDEARAAAVNLAGLHGPRWSDPTLDDIEWLSAMDADAAEMVASITADATTTFVDRYRDRLDPADRETLTAVAPRLGRWITAHPERFAPIHGDYRLDNLLFADATDPSTAEDPVAAVDWQTVTLGLPARDLAYLLSTGLRVEDRRRHEDELVATYHSALVAHGVTGHSLGECRADYRFAMLQGPLITIVGAAYGEPTERGDEMFLAMAARSCAAIRDLGTLDLV